MNLLEVTIPPLGARLGFYLFFKPVRINKPFDEDLRNGVSEKLRSSRGDVRVHLFGPDNGDAVILIHGWSSAGVVFQKLIRTLTENGFRCIVPDMPAHGSSSGKSTNVFEFKDVIDTLRKTYPSADTIVGHSLGAVSSTLSILENPSGITNLIMVASPVYLDQILDHFFSTVGGGSRIKNRMKSLLEKRFGQRENEVSVGFRMKDLSADIRLLIIHDVNDLEVPYEQSRDLLVAPNSQHYSSEGYGHTRLLKNELVLTRIIEHIEGKPV